MKDSWAFFSTAPPYSVPQVALRSAQKELERLQQQQQQQGPADAPPAHPSLPRTRSTAGTQTAPGSRPGSASSTAGVKVPDPRLHQLEGALRQATSDYQMLLAGACVGVLMCGCEVGGGDVGALFVSGCLTLSCSS